MTRITNADRAKWICRPNSTVVIGIDRYGCVFGWVAKCTPHPHFIGEPGYEDEPIFTGEGKTKILAINACIKAERREAKGGVNK